jgi:CheY-like chemotaxis protein
MIANAKKFTPAGGTITVTATAFTKQGFSGQRPFLSLSRSPSPSTKSHTLRFAVTDNGIGLSPETIPLLFKEFSPGDPSYARQFGGTGLGLFICKRIVELLGGRIGVDSAGLGQGCTFWVEIDYSPDDVYLMPTEEGPLSQIRKARRSSKTSKRSRDKLAKTPSEELLLMDQTLKAGSGSTSISSLASVTLTPKTDFTQFLAAGEAVDVVAGSSPGIPAVSPPAGLLGQRLPLQILVVEDNVVNCKLVLKLLSKEGYFKGEHIAIAENGTEAVELVLARRNSSPLDVILMDIQMPVG